MVVLVTGASGVLLGGCGRPPAERPVPPRQALAVEAAPPSCTSKGDAVAWSIAWLDETHVAFIDSDSEQVVTCGAGTASSRRFGRQGSGPGEFIGAYVLRPDPNGGVVVGDIRANAVTEFSSTGEYKASSRIPGLPSHLLALSGDTLWLVWTDVASHMSPTVGWVTIGGNVPHPLFHLRTEDASDSSSGLVDQIFAVASENGTKFFYANVKGYRIVEVSTTGDVLRIFGRSDQLLEYPSEAEISARMATIEGMARGRGVALPASMEQSFKDRMRHQSKPLLAMQSFALAPDGKLWVITLRHPGDSTDVDIFSADGTLSRTVVLRDTVRALAFRGNRVAALVSRASSDIVGGVVDVYVLAPRKLAASK